MGDVTSTAESTSPFVPQHKWCKRRNLDWLWQTPHQGQHIWYSNHTSGWMTEKLWFNSWQGQKIFGSLTFQEFKPAPKSTQRTIQWELWVHFPRIKWLGSDAEHSIPLVAKLKISGAIPPCHHMPSRYTQWQQNTFPWWQHVWNHRDSEHATEYGFQAVSCEPMDKTGQTSGKNQSVVILDMKGPPIQYHLSTMDANITELQFNRMTIHLSPTQYHIYSTVLMLVINWDLKHHHQQHNHNHWNLFSI